MEELSLCSKIEEQEKQEEILWCQKSWNRWLTEGERNTKFFDHSVIQNRMQNKILALKNARGVRVENRDEIEATLNQHFSDIPSDPRQDRREDIEKITRLIPRLVSNEKNDLLTKPITLNWVEEAVSQMKEGAAPRPDGFTENFFHHFWGLVKMDMWRMVEDSRVSWRILPALNATFLTLIPKSERADSPDKSKPISLCNVIYKIATKVIANRLKPLLPSLISPEQSGFVEGRQITDGIILVHETLHSIKVRNLPGMMVKLDIAKAYDKLNWQFIRKMLEAFGFRLEWINWVMNLVISGFFSLFS